MSETLLIHYSIEDAQHATWALCNNDGELTGKITHGSLSELGEAAKNFPVVILLDSQCLHINQLQLPTQNLAKLLKAVPYAIEEFIADDVDSFHFVIAKNKHNNATSVVGVKKTTLDNILQQFKNIGIHPEKIIPDALCLAADNKQWACLNFNNTDYLQTDITSSLQVSHNLLPYVLKSKLETETPPEKILFFSEQASPAVYDEIKEENIFNDESIEIINISYNAHPLVIFCGNIKQAASLNLLQGSYKPERRTSGYWQHWRLAASLAAIWLVLHLGLTSFQHSKIKAENSITKAKIEKIYKKSFPKSKKIVNPRVQMEQKLKALKGSAGSGNQGLIFLLAESFGNLPVNEKEITLQSLTFRNNRMEVGLESSNLQAVETLNKNLNKNKNIKSEITSSSSEKNKVKGNLRIERRS